MNMSENMSDKARAITKYIIAHPGSSQNKIYDEVKGEFERAHAKAESKAHAKNRNAKPEEVKFDRISVLRRVKFLQARDLLRVEKGPRNAKLCWLTVKGLIYAIKQDLIEPKDAYEVERKHKLEVPCNSHCDNCTAYVSGPGEECRNVKAFKDNHPEVFFRLLSRMPNILDSQEEKMSMFSCLSAILGTMYLYITNQEFRNVCYDDALKLGCFEWTDPSFGVGPILSPIGETMLSALNIELPKAWKETIEKEQQELDEKLAEEKR